MTTQAKDKDMQDWHDGFETNVVGNDYITYENHFKGFYSVIFYPME